MLDTILHLILMNVMLDMLVWLLDMFLIIVISNKFHRSFCTVFVYLPPPLANKTTIPKQCWTKGVLCVDSREISPLRNSSVAQDRCRVRTITVTPRVRSKYTK